MLRKDGSSDDYLPERTAYHGEIPYSFLSADEATALTIHDMVLKTFAPFLNVMVLVSPEFASEIPEHGTELGAELFERLAECATTLIVGAYHQEAHVVWRKE